MQDGINLLFAIGQTQGRPDDAELGYVGLRGLLKTVGVRRCAMSGNTKRAASGLASWRGLLTREFNLRNRLR